MNSITLQVIFIAGVIAFLAIIIYFITKNTLSLKYSLVWLFSGAGMLAVAVFPQLLVFVSDLFGFQVASNAVFSLLTAFCILIILSLTSIVSGQNEKIKTLAQSIALFEQRVRDVEGNAP